MIGKILANKYYIDSVVGSGGMATVYKAHILSNNKVVAIKVLKDEHKSILTLSGALSARPVLSYRCRMKTSYAPMMLGAKMEYTILFWNMSLEKH